MEEGRPDDDVRFGEFLVVGEVGRGGMGIVYEAEQASLRRRVAVKVLPPELCTDPTIVARFRREAEAAGRLRHRGIVAVHAVGEEAGRPYFAMELVQGRSLTDVLDDRKGGGDADLPPAGEPWRRWCVEMVANVADALAYAHTEGVLHRDVKPGNILLDRDGAARLVDFGLASDSEAGSLTAPGAVLGTPIYMSPEQAEGGAPLDGRSDVYSLAVTLYQALTGEIPYDAKTNSEVFAALLTGRTVPIASRDPAIPGPLAGVVMRALTKERDARPADAAVFALELRRSLEASSAPPVAAPARPGSSRRVGRVVITLGLVVLAAWGVIELIGDGEPDGPAVPFSPFTSAEPIAWSELEELADGTSEDPDEVLDRWLRPQVIVRSVLSRKAPGRVRCQVVIEGGRLTGEATDEVLLVAVWQSRLGDGPWTARSLETVRVKRNFGHPAETTWAIGRSAAGALRGETVQIASRLTVRVVRPTASQLQRHVEARAPALPVLLESTEMPDLAAYEGGTTWTWSDETTLFVYDDYPDDYPEAVTGGEHRDAMQATLTPKFCYRPELQERAGKRYVLVYAHFTDVGGPLQVACDVELFMEGHDRLLGVAPHRAEPAPANMPAIAIERAVGFLFELPASPTREEQRALIDLTGKTARRLRLVFKPSRQLALETQADRYWGEEHEASVPITDRESP